MSVRRWLFRRVVGLSLAAASVLGSCVVSGLVLALGPESKGTPEWNAASGFPVPDEFLYVMFPADAAVPLCDYPDGVPVGSLGRAVVNSQAEVRAGGWAAVRDGERTAWAPLNRLTFIPPENWRELFAGFVRAYKGRAPELDRRVTARFRGAAGTNTVRLRLWPDDDHREDFEYELTAGGPKAIAMYRAGPIEVLGGGFMLVIALAAGIGFLVVVALVFDLRADRRRRSLAAAAAGGEPAQAQK
jgi:hypothetical protein